MSNEKVDALMKLLQKQEPLHPDLIPYLGETEMFQALRHPLVFGVPYTETMNAMYNEQYKHKVQYRDEAFEQGKWSSYIFIHEKPYRVEALHDLEYNHADEVPDKEFWEIFGDVWTNIENMWQMDQQVRNLLEMAEHHGRENQDAMMDELELKLKASLPDQFVVYRGHQGINDFGLSWTLSPWRAQWFAHRWDTGDAEVYRSWATKSDIIGLFLGRSEMEVGIIPEFLQHMEPLYAADRSALIEEMRDIAEERFKLGHRSFHGYWHWDNVERNALAICERTPEADPVVCQLFANLHDCCRVDEDEDPQHGKRAAKFVLELIDSGKLSLEVRQQNLLIEAISDHNEGRTHSDPTIGACWDADRMDLPRVNIIPDLKFFSTEAAKNLLWRV